MKRKIKILSIILAACAAAVLILSVNIIPSNIKIKKGEIASIDFLLPVSIEFDDEAVSVIKQDVATLSGNITSVAISADHSSNIKTKMFGIPVKDISP